MKSLIKGIFDLLFPFLGLHYFMKEFLCNFILSAKGGHVYLGHGYEYTFSEITEIVFGFFS